MKKRILIVNSSFSLGGIQSSLQNLLEVLKDDYDIDLMVFYPNGPFKSKVPDGIRVLEPDWRMEAIGMKQRTCLKKGSIKQIIFRTFCAVWSALVNNGLPFKIIAKHARRYEGYDAAIAYRHEGRKHALNSGYISYIVNCIGAKRKIAWIHNDNGSFPLDETYNESSYASVDSIVGVSKAVIDGFIKHHPTLADKCYYCHNFLNPTEIIERSNEKQVVPFIDGKLICFSACRLSPIKGIPRAINAIAPILRKNDKIMWYIAGDGVDKSNIERAIADNGMSGRIILIGYLDNPYPYIKNADLVMLLSFHEAAPMLYSEARLLKTPVFTTRLASSVEMLGNGEAAFICDNSEEGIHECFEHIMDNMDELTKKKAWLEKDVFCQDETKEMFEAIISK